MHDYDHEMPLNSISEDLFFKNFPGWEAYPRPPSIGMLRMLIVLPQQLAFMTTHPKLYAHI